MERLIKKVKLYRIMRLAYSIKWWKVGRSRRQYYLFLYMGDVYCDRGWMWHIDWKGEACMEGAVSERKKSMKKAKGVK